MRAAPLLRFTVRRFGAWRLAMAIAAFAGVGACMAWWLTAPEPVDARVRALTAIGLLAALGPLLHARRRDPMTVHWDGRRWHVGTTAAVEAGQAPGGILLVAIDLGDWLLLRFVADPKPTARRRLGGDDVAWIPVQRRGLDADWLALRITVYCPPPVAAVPGSSAGPPE